MALATVDSHGNPGCRFVLLKHVDAADGFAVFYTHYDSAKGQAMQQTPTAAATFYWPLAGRQLRLEGISIQSPADESDRYFASRPRLSQLNAWASAQSQPVEPPGLMTALESLERRFPEGQPITRPPRWGGYRLWFRVIEFWTEGQGRFHERIRYQRRLDPGTEGRFKAGNWQHEQLQPETPEAGCNSRVGAYRGRLPDDKNQRRNTRRAAGYEHLGRH